jgi:proteasome accessory factor A
MGMETEYCVAGVYAEGLAVETQRLATRILSAVKGAECHLPDARNHLGIFLQNGGRLYLDCHSHPEFATPEAPNPWEIVRYGRAGERIISDALRTVARKFPSSCELLLFRSNVDYSGEETTVGCHESYLHRGPAEDLEARLIPHLVTRPIYAGAGGFRPNLYDPVFTLSPRSWYFGKQVSTNSTHDRGIFHRKEESLCGHGFRRLHVICGDTVCSDIAGVLKIGTTALIVAAIDQGERPRKDLSLANPVASLRSVACDPTCTVKLILASGERWSAIQIQRYLHQWIDGLADKGVLPDWATPLCRMWHRILELLEHAPESVQTTLDWAIKYAVFREWVEKESSAERFFCTWSPGYPQMPRTLFEADLRFGLVGEGGTFSRLDRDGLLTHRLFEDDEIEDARHEPPSAGRARARSILVSGHGRPQPAPGLTQFECDWRFCPVKDTRLYVDLSDPFRESIEWRLGGSRGRAPPTF